MLIGYIRVSTNGQNTGLQRNALECAGCEQIFEDKMSGKTTQRPGLKRALKKLKPGDTLMVWKLDRLGRFFFHIMGALAEMERELIVERTRAGLAAARERGRTGGRPRRLTQEQYEQVGRLLAGGVSRRQVALIFDIGLSTLYRYYPASVSEK